jgi:hypothetical protein
MPTPIPFNALRGQFIPNISSLGEVNRQVARMKALGIKPTAPAAPGALSRLGGVGRILGPLGSFLDVGISNYEASQQRNQLRQQNPGFLGEAQANLYGLAQTLTGGPFSPLPQAVKTAQEVYGLKSKPSNQAPPRVVRFPEDYKRTELEAGLGAEQFRPGAGVSKQETLVPCKNT